MGLFERKITVNTAINIVRTSENAYLIDCREKTEYAAGHVSGAVNWTIDKMTPDRVTRRFPDKTSIIYVIGNYTWVQECEGWGIYGRTSREACEVRKYR